MEQEAFYKDQYDKSLDRKNEINSSLSTPIGILTALVAGLFYCTTTFDFSDRPTLTIIFAIIGAVSLVLLSKSIFHLVKALSDLHEGYDYAYLADTDDLDKYYTGLLNFYNNQPRATPASARQSAQNEFDAYLVSELIKSAGINQKNNKAKMFQRFKCHQFMIFAFISLSLLIIPFGIDFGITKGKDKIQKVKIESVIQVNLNIKCQDTPEPLNIKTPGNGKANRRKTNTAADSNDQGGR
jgi:hypothetical protein